MAKRDIDELKYLEWLVKYEDIMKKELNNFTEDSTLSDLKTKVLYYITKIQINLM